MLGNIYFNNIDSSSFGLLVNYSNISVKPLKRNAVLNVIGKDGGQIFSDQYNVYEIILDCRLKDDVIDRRKTGREIASWLNETGELIIGIEPDVKYTAQCLNAIRTRPFFVLENFFISFLVQPIKRSTLEADLIWNEANVPWNEAEQPWNGFDFTFEDITSGDIIEITTQGNYQSLPTMIISGQATTLSIADDNGNVFTFSNLNGTINVDSENLLVYSGNNPKVNEISSSNAEFISLNVGLNTIDVTGTGFVGLTITFENVSAFL